MIYNAGYFTFGDVDSREYNVHISGGGTFDAPERDVEFVSIDGRNGDIAQDNGRFQNVEITYPAFISRSFLENFDAFRAAMYLQSGYQRLYDSYHPLEYREAVLRMAIQPDTGAWNRSGKFDITFNCKPQRFLLSGADAVEYSLVSTGGIDAETGADFENPYYYRVEYTPVTPGTLFEADVTYQSGVSNVLLVAWYDENKTFISSESVDPQTINVPVTAWTQGTISASTGNTGSSPTRCRADGSYNYDDAFDTVTLKVASGYKVAWREYSDAPTSTSNYVGTDGEFYTGEYSFAPVEGHYYRYIIGATDDRNITPGSLPSDVLTVSYRDSPAETYSASLVVPSNAYYARVMYAMGAGTYSGSTGLTINNNGVETHYGDDGILLVNPTGFTAQPIIHVTVSGAATLTVTNLSPINAVTNTQISIADFSETGFSTVAIDSTIGDSYSVDALFSPMSLNSYVTITDGSGNLTDYPTLEAGRTIISTPSTVTKISVQAGWWTV